MRALISFGLIASVLSGCAGRASPQNSVEKEQATQQAAFIKTQCLSKYPETIGRLFERQQCLTDSASALMPFYSPALNAVVSKCSENLLTLARSADTGAITLAAYNTQKNALRANCNAAINKLTAEEKAGR